VKHSPERSGNQGSHPFPSNGGGDRASILKIEDDYRQIILPAKRYGGRVHDRQLSRYNLLEGNRRKKLCRGV
ncbi:uncharacterized protein METZ01_LOCUS186073, partial [marine metagenome]